MSHATSRPIPARRMFGDTDLSRMDARRVPFDSDYGPYNGDPRDPRYVGPSECPECMGTKRNAEGEKCEFCAGTGHYWENDE